MTPAIQNWIKQKVSDGTIPRVGWILEVGSRDVNGTVREFFDQHHYWGIDIEAGLGVDEVADVHDIAIVKHFDVAICLEVLEHDSNPWDAVERMRNSLIPGGTLVISVPYNGFPEHKYPIDCFRFLEDSFPHFFFKGMNMLALDKISSVPNEYTLIGCARKV